MAVLLATFLFSRGCGCGRAPVNYRAFACIRHCGGWCWDNGVMIGLFRVTALVDFGDLLVQGLFLWLIAAVIDSVGRGGC